MSVRYPISSVNCSAVILGLTLMLLVSAIFLGCGSSKPEQASRPAARRVPLIYSTDIYSPPADPDDYFDLACMFAMPEIEIRALILDDAAPWFSQAERPGEVPLAQMEKITSRSVPHAVGLRQAMTSPSDRAQDAPSESLAGVELILKTLRDSQ